jgi:hypothetical protein
MQEPPVAEIPASNGKKRLLSRKNSVPCQLAKGGSEEECSALETMSSKAEIL